MVERLYHYATWAGEFIEQDRVIRPSEKYALWTRQTLLTRWPELIFLSYNEYWEPCIQSYTKDQQWEKCGSFPETNAALDIPCWKFRVNQNGLVLGDVEFYETDTRWEEMLADAIKMGSHIDDWKITIQDCYVIDAYKWEDDEWVLKRT